MRKTLHLPSNRRYSSRAVELLSKAQNEPDSVTAAFLRGLAAAYASRIKVPDQIAKIATVNSREAYYAAVVNETPMSHFPGDRPGPKPVKVPALLSVWKQGWRVPKARVRA